MLDNSAILCAFPDQYFKSISNFDNALLQELILRQKQIFLALNKPFLQPFPYFARSI